MLHKFCRLSICIIKFYERKGCDLGHMKLSLALIGQSHLSGAFLSLAVCVCD